MLTFGNIFTQSDEIINAYYNDVFGVIFGKLIMIHRIFSQTNIKLQCALMRLYGNCAAFPSNTALVNFIGDVKTEAKIVGKDAVNDNQLDCNKVSYKICPRPLADLYKHRFTDKNALLNFKQVMKSNSKLSMLLFERGCDVLNLKYTIIIEEASPDDNVGLRLKEPIIVKSDEEFSL